MNRTLGGMTGDNSCGATAQRDGKVVDNIAALEVPLYDGTRFWCGPTDDEGYAAIERSGDQQARVYRRLRKLRDTYQDQIGARHPDIPGRAPHPRQARTPGARAARAHPRPGDQRCQFSWPLLLPHPAQVIPMASRGSARNRSG
jgi:hypothetical protein